MINEPFAKPCVALLEYDDFTSPPEVIVFAETFIQQSTYNVSLVLKFMAENEVDGKLKALTVLVIDCDVIVIVPIDVYVEVEVFTL